MQIPNPIPESLSLQKGKGLLFPFLFFLVFNRHTPELLPACTHHKGTVLDILCTGIPYL